MGGAPDAVQYDSEGKAYTDVRGVTGTQRAYKPALNMPPRAPDLTDEMVQRAQLAARRRAMMGSGLSSTFLTGPLGDSTPPPTKAGY